MTPAPCLLTTDDDGCVGRGVSEFGCWMKKRKKIAKEERRKKKEEDEEKEGGVGRKE